MKKTIYSFIAAAAACGFAGAQTTAYTTPVGYMTIPIPGTGGVGTSRLQIANQGLLPNGPAAAGGGATVSFSGTTLTDTAGAFTPSAFVNGSIDSHVLEITSAGLLQGALSWISANTATTITTDDDLSGAGSGASYRVWKAYTMATLFGDPPAPTVLGGGADGVSADTVQILDPVSNTYTSFFYKNSGKGGTGWRSSDVGIASPKDTAIFPNDGMVILRKQSGPGSLVVSGSVKTGATSVRVEGNGSSTVLNILANQVPVNQITPALSGLYTGNAATGLKGGADAVEADTILVFNAAANSYTTFFYKSSGKGGTGWRSSDPAITVPQDYAFPSDSSLLIQRKAGAAFNWKIPSVTVAP